MRGRIYANTENFMGADSGTSTTEQKNGVSADVIRAVGEAVGATIEAIATVKDIKLRREFEQRYQALSEEQKAKLDEKILQAKTDADRRAILANSLTSLNVARIQAFSKEGMNTMLWVIGGVILIGSIYIVYKKSKKK